MDKVEDIVGSRESRQARMRADAERRAQQERDKHNAAHIAKEAKWAGAAALLEELIKLYIVYANSQDFEGFKLQRGFGLGGWPAFQRLNLWHQHDEVKSHKLQDKESRKKQRLPM